MMFMLFSHVVFLFVSLLACLLVGLSVCLVGCLLASLLICWFFMFVSLFA